MMMELIGNHLWQSTLFAAVAALLTLFFRKNHAQIRYALWLSASIKFLIPFSFLIALGNSIEFHWLESAPAAQTAVAYVQDIGQPFESSWESLEAERAIEVHAPSHRNPWTCIFLCSVWICGITAVLGMYLLKGLRIVKVVQRAERLTDHRLGVALQSLRIAGRCKRQIRLASSPDSIEPGIFGILHPVLLFPKGILDRLSHAELEAIVAHEIAHVRRHDNLFAAIHMLIEAIFWFHPMIWWLGAKLVEERENACDEAVLRLGKDPQSYAEGILKVCEFCLESPLACVAGITGADMKRRIQAIMTHRIGLRLGPAKKLVLAIAGLCAIAIPIAIGLVNVPMGRAMMESIQKPSPEMTASAAPIANEAAKALIGREQQDPVRKLSFDVASIKPDVECLQKMTQSSRSTIVAGREEQRTSIQSFNPNPPSFLPGGRFTGCGSLKTFMIHAYQLDPWQITGEPEWVGKALFQIDARAEGNPDKAQMRVMLQSLLEERFKLKIHRQAKEVETYALVVAKGGAKLKEARDENGNPIGERTSLEEIRKRYETALRSSDPFNAIRRIEPWAEGDLFQVRWGDKTASMKSFANWLGKRVGKVVVDKTGLSGVFDIELWYYNDSPEIVMLQQRQPAPESLPPSITKAIQEQLGLKLEPDRASLEFALVDNAEKPSEN